MGTHKKGTKPHNTLKPYSKDFNDFIEWFATCPYEELYECVNSSYRVRHFKRFKYGAEKKLDGFVLLYRPESRKYGCYEDVFAGYTDPSGEHSLGREMQDLIAIRKPGFGMFNSGAMAGHRKFFNENDRVMNPDHSLGLTYHQYRFQRAGLLPMPFYEVNNQLVGSNPDEADVPRILDAEVIDSCRAITMPCVMGLQAAAIMEYSVRHIQGDTLYKFGDDMYLYGVDNRDILYGVVNQFLSRLDMSVAKERGIEVNSVAKAYEVLVPSELYDVGITSLNELGISDKIRRQGELVFASTTSNRILEMEDIHNLEGLFCNYQYEQTCVARTMLAPLPDQLMSCRVTALNNMCLLVQANSAMALAMEFVVHVADRILVDGRIAKGTGVDKSNKTIDEVEKFMHKPTADKCTQPEWIRSAVRESLSQVVNVQEWNLYESEPLATVWRAFEKVYNYRGVLRKVNELVEMMKSDPSKAREEAVSIVSRANINRQMCTNILRDMRCTFTDPELVDLEYVGCAIDFGLLYGHDRMTYTYHCDRQTVISSSPAVVSSFDSGMPYSPSGGQYTLGNWIRSIDMDMVAEATGHRYSSKSEADASRMLIWILGDGRGIESTAARCLRSWGKDGSVEAFKDFEDSWSDKRVLQTASDRSYGMFNKAMCKAILANGNDFKRKFAIRVDGWTYSGGRHHIASMVVHTGNNGVFGRFNAGYESKRSTGGTLLANHRENGSGTLARGWIFQNEDHVPLYVPTWSLVFRNEATDSVNFTGRID